jgi:hypothetical protein
MTHLYKIREKTGEIFKWRENKQDFLLVTYSKDKHQDRRRAKCEVQDCRWFSTSRAEEMISESWKNASETWEYNGQTFHTGGTLYDQYPNQVRHDDEYGYKYSLVWHHGHLFKAFPFHYWPRVQLLDIYNQTAMSKWTHAKNCKIVLNENNEMI